LQHSRLARLPSGADEDELRAESYTIDACSVCGHLDGSLVSGVADESTAACTLCLLSWHRSCCTAACKRYRGSNKFTSQTHSMQFADTALPDDFLAPGVSHRLSNLNAQCSASFEFACRIAAMHQAWTLFPFVVVVAALSSMTVSVFCVAASLLVGRVCGIIASGRPWFRK
jgi:hypothetical protein